MAKRGPKPTFERVAANKEGAPLLAVRLDPKVYTQIKARPEGARAYIERLVTEDASESNGGTPLNGIDEEAEP